MDLPSSLDLRPFLMHDRTLRRTTGLPLPVALTPGFIVRKQRLKGSDERVPSLSQAFEARAPEMRLAVDVKTPWAVAPLRRETRRRRLEKRVLVWCQSALAVRYAARYAPDVEIAYLKDGVAAAGQRGHLRA